MSCTAAAQPKTIYRRQTATFVLTVVDENGERFDLTGSTLYMRAKNKETDADPAIIALLTGTGITHRAQTGATLGQADIVMTSAQTALLAAQANVYDVWLQKPSSERSPIIPVSPLTVLTPVTNL